TEAAQMIAAMQAFRDLFAGENPAKKLIRGIGLMAAATLPGIKTQFIKRALGLSGDLPKLAKK
ncbi:2-octaprenylphenol hydroxylase, partial [Enterovibrio norvegicus DSM 15893]